MEHGIAIIGAGPRGTYALDQLRRQLTATPTKGGVRIYVFESSGRFGAGNIYHPDQPDYLLMNTIASQVTMYLGDEGPTLLKWLQQKFGMESVDENTYPPRNKNGLYLAAGFDVAAHCLPQNVTLVRVTDQLSDVIPDGGSGGYSLVFKSTGAEGKAISVNKILLTTGNSKNKPSPDSDEGQFLAFSEKHEPRLGHKSFIPFAYPVERNITELPDGARVGIKGLGLTAIDVILAGSEGKGGKFEKRTDGSFTYTPSGRELKMTAFSRSGLFLMARAINEKGLEPKKAIFLTRDKIDALREQSKAEHGSPKLNFKDDIRPLIVREMEYEYYSSLKGADFAQAYIAAAGKSDDSLDALIKTIPENERFNFNRLISPTNGMTFASPEEYKEWLVSYTEKDIQNAEMGNVTCPLKAATDKLRDIRDNIRYAIDFGGLTPRGHKESLSSFESINNRLAVGPPIDSIRKLLALVKAGIIDVAAGRGAEVQTNQDGGYTITGSSTRFNASVKYLVDARIHHFDIEHDSSELMQGLLQRGMVRPYDNTLSRKKHTSFRPGGIEVTETHKVVGADGKVSPDISALGLLAEGVRWFTSVLARPGIVSVALKDAKTWAEKTVSELLEREANIGRPGNVISDIAENDKGKGHNI